MTLDKVQAHSAMGIAPSSASLVARRKRTLRWVLTLAAVVSLFFAANELRLWRRPLLPAAREAALKPQLLDSNGNILDMCEQHRADCSGTEHVYYYDDGTNAITSATSSHTDYEVDGKPTRATDESKLVVVRVNSHGETMSAVEYKTGIEQQLTPDGKPDGQRKLSIIENGVPLNFADGLIRNLTEAAQ